MPITIDGERDGFDNGPTPSGSRGAYRCPTCGMRAPNKKEHNSDGDCSILTPGVPIANRAPQPQLAWFGHETTGADD